MDNATIDPQAGATPPPTDTGAGESNSQSGAIRNAISEASGAALAEFNAGTKQPGKPGRPPGKKDSQPRKKPFSVGSVAPGSDSPLLEKNPSHVVPVDFSAPAPAFDTETVKAIVEGCAGVIEEVGGWLCSAIVLRGTRSEALARKVAALCKMTENQKHLIVFGGTGCAQKYLGAQMQYAHEAALLAGVALFVGGTVHAAKAAVAEFKNLQPQQAAA